MLKWITKCFGQNISKTASKNLSFATEDFREIWDRIFSRVIENVVVSSLLPVVLHANDSGCWQWSKTVATDRSRALNHSQHHTGTQNGASRMKFINLTISEIEDQRSPWSSSRVEGYYYYHKIMISSNLLKTHLGGELGLTCPFELPATE